MNWPTPAMAPGLGVVAGLAAGWATWSAMHSPLTAIGVALIAGALVALVVRRVGRPPDA